MANLKTCGALGLDAAESLTRLAQKEKKTPMDHSLDDLLPPSRTGHAAHPLLNMHHYTSLALPSRVAAANHLVFLMPPHYRRPPVSSPQSRRLHLSPSLPLLIRREEGDFFFSNTEEGDRPGLAPAMAAATSATGAATSPNRRLDR